MKASNRWHQMHHSPPTSSRILLPLFDAVAIAFCRSRSGFAVGSNLPAAVCSFGFWGVFFSPPPVESLALDSVFSCATAEYAIRPGRVRARQSWPDIGSARISRRVKRAVRAGRLGRLDCGEHLSTAEMIRPCVLEPQAVVLVCVLPVLTPPLFHSRLVHPKALHLHPGPSPESETVLARELHTLTPELRRTATVFPSRVVDGQPIPTDGCSGFTGS